MNRTRLSRALLLAAASGVLLLPPSAARPDEGSAGGLDLAAMDRSIAPGDDFFAFANGAWVKATEIPPDRGGWGVFAQLAEQSLLRTRKVLEEAAAAPEGSEARKVGDFYASFMDEEGIEARGLSPLEPELARVAAVKDVAGLSRVLGEDLRADVDALNRAEFHTSRLFGLWVAPDLSAPGRSAPYLLQGGLGMPDRDYYLDPSPRMEALRGKYRAHIEAMFGIAGMGEGAARAARVLALETRMAGAHARREESEDVLKANNPWPRAELAARAPGLDWGIFLRAAGLDRATTLVAWQPGAIRGLSALVRGEPLEAWKDWLAFHAIDRASAVLPRAFVDEGFAFYETALAGTPRLPERWKRGVGLSNDALGDAVGKLYVKAYFPPDSKVQVQAMVRSITAAFTRRINRLDWMAASTRARAKQKVASLYVGVGYPERWIDYRALEVRRGDAFGNWRRAELFELRRSLAKLGAPVDPREWCMSPQTVNAVNLPLQNALNFPAAILAPPFFDPAAPASMNYGAIGAVIGHEISHSFDDQGAQFDARGKLSDWWTPEDRAHFSAGGAQLAAQYDAYQPFPDAHVNGKLTLSENIADLAGLAAAFDAWSAAQGGKRVPSAQGLTGEQQFFLAFAQAWRNVLREATLRQRIIVDGHAPAQYRADTVRNLDAWYSAFGVEPGGALYLPEAQRIRVW